MEAFRSVCQPEFYFVGGYHFEEIASRYPEIHFSFNPSWQKSGSVRSLLSAPLPETSDLLITYSDIVLRSEAIASVLSEQGDLVVGMDSNWRERYSSRSKKDMLQAEKIRLSGGNLVEISRAVDMEQASGEFVGLMKTGPAVVRRILQIAAEQGDQINTWDLPRLVEQLIQDGQPARVVECAGKWAELNAPQDLAHFVLGTKAETLARLRSLVQKSYIGEQVTVDLEKWQQTPQRVISSIQAKFPSAQLAVRSSARSEDSWTESNAGGFTSLLNVQSSKPAEVSDAIEQVIASYGDDNPKHQVLVQAVVANVVRSGVVLTRGLGRGAPYYTFNFEDSERTDGVTSGAGTDMRTVVLHRSQSSLTLVPDLDPVFQAVLEIESLLGYDALDIEFAQSADGQVHILQVRPLVLQLRMQEPSDKTVMAALRQASALFSRRRPSEPWLLEGRPIFGVMPDWNPAEIVGTNPRPLALSLYQYLITDDIWARQRAEHGYRDVRPQPLLVNFTGHPYVDARASFASFIPTSLSTELASRLLAHYVDRLAHHPELHDKVEFEIAFTCLYFDFDQQANQRLRPAGFSQSDIAELREGLRQVTLNAFQRFENDLARVLQLEERIDALKTTGLQPLDRAFTLLQDCREYGTLPFAHLARAGFVAVTLLRSLVRCGVLSNERLEAFINSLNTVTRSFEVDSYKVARGELSREEFIAGYGHLRPGTYEITSPNYAENPDLYLGHILSGSEGNDPSVHAEFSWTAEERKTISRLLGELGLPGEFTAFEKFLRGAIAGRESSKFVFSRNLSAALEEIAAFGAEHQLGRGELSFININDLMWLRTSSLADVGAWLRARSEEGQEFHHLTESTLLPPLIRDEADFWAFEIPVSHPNFVSSKQIIAAVANLAEVIDLDLDLKGKIVLIPQADPGYDWLFGREIGGLITAYGGANSHMTIRAAELNLPAAIGVGEALLSKLASAQVVELDCKAKRINIVQ
ncbi:MAG: hypothetical protein KIS88_10600 [Anaerolineales bacterium]|nr:hypothetical protein [Anaerolineales bacterium]